MTDAFEDLREYFRESARIRLDEMAALLDTLERNATDEEARERLGRHFHAFAGLGATYGYPQLSVLGDEAEVSIRKPDATVGEWRLLVGKMNDALLTGASPMVWMPVVPPAPATYEVLLVEDDPELTLHLRQSFAAEGMSVRVAGTRGSALDALAEKLPDAVVVDIRLPDGSGFEVIEALRARPDSDDVAAIVISAFGAFTDKVRAIHSGADASFDKPLDVPALVRRLLVFRDRKHGQPSRVLVVEDDVVQARIIEKALERNGCVVSVCSDPSHFDQALSEATPDLVLLDVNLPGGVTGYDLARHLRQDDRYASVPVIFVTGDSEPESILRAMRSGGDDYIVKPAAPRQLIAAVASRLEQARLVRSVTDRDAVTGVLTRSAFLQRVEQRRRDREHVLILIDLDRFKEINDARGHAAGDAVLASVGALLRRHLRQFDLIGRFGGDEFVFVLEGVSLDEARALATQLLADFQSIQHRTDGATFQTSFTAGVAPLGDSLEEALRNADAALYEAKREGRGRVG